MVKTFARNKPRIVLALQGGGALGAYQAGVYQALHEHQFTPDWVVGTSIGAINAALIAGNAHAARLDRLQEFWEVIAHKDWLKSERVPDWAQRMNVGVATLTALAKGIPGFFTPRLFNPFVAGLPVAAEAASFYDTSPLAQTLARLIDVDLLNDSAAMRLTVGAVQVTTAQMTNFDSAKRRLGIEHVLASGAIPPGFPPVRIDGQLYWDGGLYSNTPLETVLNDSPRQHTLCFMVDLWFAEGAEPTTLDEVQSRQKEVMFASRSQRHIEAYAETHNLRRQLHALYNQLTPAQRLDPTIVDLASGSCDTTLHVVRLQYPGHDWGHSSKDINFSAGSIAWRWEKGYSDALRALAQAAWLKPIQQGQGVIVHELNPTQALEPGVELTSATAIRGVGP